MYFVCCCYIEHMTTFPLGADSYSFASEDRKENGHVQLLQLWLWEHVNRNLHPTSESMSAAWKKTKAP